MAKTYTAVPTVTAGDVYTASAYNTYTSTNISNLIVPPTCQARRTTTLSSYSSGSAITWESSGFDTDGMWSAGTPTRITIQTSGVYVVTLSGGWGATATVTRAYANIIKNATTVAIQECFGVSIGGSFSFATTLNLVATDYLTASVNIVGGSAYSVAGSASESDTQTRLTATWIGRTS